MLIPTTPNRPLSSRAQDEVFGEMTLRFNAELGLLENQAFDVNSVIYDDDYQKNQSLSPSFRLHMKEVYSILKATYPEGAKLVEVGCGKGDFVEMLVQDAYFHVEGFDGAYEGDSTYISKRYLSESDSIEADIVVLRHVLEHIQQPHLFLQLLRSIFNGADIYIEVPDYQWIIDNDSFFDITYEHVNYFQPRSLQYLFRSFRQSGLLFSGQYQFILSNLKDVNDDFILQYDEIGNWSNVEIDELFPSLKKTSFDILKQISQSNRNAYVWGASTKGVMFLHHLKLNNGECFDFFKGAIDINAKKVGKFMPSTRLPIFGIKDYVARAKMDDFIVIANPNYKQEIMKELSRNDLGSVDVFCL